MDHDRTCVTVPAVSATKAHRGGAPLVMVTAYDYHSARLADAAGVDILLVGDSLGMVVQGRDDTLGVTLDDVVYHARCVARARPGALIVGDLPWLTYHVSVEDAVRNAGRLVREGGVAAVKLEGGSRRLPVVRAIIDAEIPVMGHLGLTPQSVHRMGGYRVQARDEASAAAALDDARALEEAGVFALVLEGIPAEVAAAITAAVEVPTIGIGAGPSCDGQVLVWHDLLGITPAVPRFVRRYDELGSRIEAALRSFADDVRSRRFPSDTESYHGPGARRGVAAADGARSPQGGITG